MLTSLLELLFVIAACVGSGALIRRAQVGRAQRRATDLASSGTASFPCRISWPAGTGKRAFVYGKVAAGADGQLTLSRPGRSSVPLPRSAWVHRDPCWRTGMLTLRYAVPGQGDVRMMLVEKDAETVERLLRGGAGTG